MGRKIPAKKHRGVKDPLVQQAKRLQSLKGKINAPPKDPDEQPVPRSLLRLFSLKDQDKKKNIIKKKHARRLHDKDNSADGPSYNPISQLRKLPGESGRGFSLRINSAIKALHDTAEQLHYPIDIETEDVKGMRMAEQRERRARRRRRAAAAHAGQGGAHHPSEPCLTRTQKLALKRKAKKIKVSEANKERQEVVYERVSFGEVTHAPPTLHFKSKGNTGAARPGRRNLLLSSLLAGHKSEQGSTEAAASRAARPTPPAELRRRERARLDAVAAYRALKATKLKNK